MNDPNKYELNLRITTQAAHTLTKAPTLRLSEQLTLNKEQSGDAEQEV